MKSFGETLRRGAAAVRQGKNMRRVLWMILVIHSILLCSSLLFMAGSRIYYGRLFGVQHQNVCQQIAGHTSILLRREFGDVAEMLYQYASGEKLAERLHRIGDSAISPDILAIREVMDDIHLLRASRSNLQDVYIISNFGDRTISSVGTTPTSWLFSRKIKGVNGETLNLDALKARGPLQILDGNIEGEGEVLLFVYPSSKVTLIAAVRKRAVQEMLNAVVAASGGLYYVYRETDLLPCLTNGDKNDLPILLADAGESVFVIHGERYLHQRSTALSYPAGAYISILLPESFWADESLMVDTGFIVLCALFIVVDLAVFALMYGNWYQPLTRIIRGLGPRRRDVGEYALIESSIHSMKEHIAESSQALHEHYIYKAAHGLMSFPDSTNAERTGLLSALPDQRPYTMMVCVLEESDGEAGQAGLKQVEEALRSAFSMLKLCAEGRETVYYVTPLDADCPADWNGMLHDACQNAAEEGYCCLVGVGTWRTDARFLQTTYDECREALQNQRITLEEEQAYYIGFHDGDGEATASAMDDVFCRNLLDCLQEGKVDEARRIMDRALRTDAPQSYRAIRETCESILLLCCMVLASKSTRASEELLEKCESVKKIWNPRLLVRKTREMVLEVIELSRLSVSDVGRALNLYITEHYADPISLDHLSEIFALSPGYISQMFKKAWGMTFMEYLQKLRILKAMELLRDTNHAVQEIASMVGYEDAGTFIRVFKKLESVTPGKYRQGVRQQNQADGKE